jgi:ornithine carbamoyltransferase
LKIDLSNKSFMSLKDFSSKELDYLINLSIKLKKDKASGIYNEFLKHKNIAMIFEKTSTRTRCAISTACFDEGAHAEFLGKDDIQMGKKESIKDTARVLGRMYDAIIFRGFKQKIVEILSKYSGVPVINGLTDDEHPTQIIADFITIKEIFGKLKGIKLTYLGDGRNNVANTLIIGCAKMGIDCVISCPKKLNPSKELINYSMTIAKENNSSIIISEDPFEAVKQSDVIYTDVWVSMGEEKNKGIKDRVKILKKYQVNAELMNATGKENSVFLHCLPATHKKEVHNMEVTEEVFESGQSYVFQQAENRLHSIKAILVATITGKSFDL